MTAAEYKRLYISAQKNFRTIIRAGKNEIKKIYEDAASQVSEILRDAQERGLSELTTGSYASITQQLEAGAKMIRDGVEPIIKDRIVLAGRSISTIDENYLVSALKDAGVRGLTTGARNIFVAVDNQLINSLYARISQAGYTFSEAIWNASLNYQEQITNVIELGLAQGRDFIDIARDIDIYVRDGKQTLLKRIGKLERGTREFRNRIRKDVDYNSIRILRSELYASMQQATVVSGHYNPGCTDFYEWIRTYIEEFNCMCPEYEENSPYSLNDVPSYPHPNCACIIRPILRDRQEFVDDLIAWKDGAEISYLDNWAQLLK